MRALVRAANVVLLATAAGLLGAGTAGADGGVLAGTWSSTDTDGSAQTLRISGSGTRTYAMYLLDQAGTVCGGAPASVAGTGVVDGDSLVLTGTLACRPGGAILGRGSIGFTYDAGSDTLTDEFGVVWRR